MNDLASAYSRLARHHEAEQLQFQALNARKRVLGEEHPDTLVSMNDLASSYSYLGRWDEAEELFNKAISIAERTLGDQHPRTQKFHKDYEDMLARQPAKL
ncbi:kinesin light chain, partial [Rhizoctonia solani AG-3 Rhs1AP]